MKRIGVVGLGLIGGSIALGARRHFAGCEIIGADRADADWPDGLLDEFIKLAADTDLPRRMPKCDVIVLAVPVNAVLSLLGPALDTGSVVTDVGSTKRQIVAASSRHEHAARYVPGHPMTGAPDGGFALARADLFSRSTWFLCPQHAEASAVLRVSELVEGLGAVPKEVTPEAHDRAVALTSHLPQLLASALTVAAEAQGCGAAAGPAFERMTRGAGGPASMWLDVFGTNADFVAEQAEQLSAQLLRIAAALRQEPPNLAGVADLVGTARRAKGGSA